MLRTNFAHGFSKTKWNATKKEARSAMIERAQIRGMLSYSDLVQQIHAVHLEPHDPRLPTYSGKFPRRKTRQGAEC